MNRAGLTLGILAGLVIGQLYEIPISVQTLFLILSLLVTGILHKKGSAYILEQSVKKAAYFSAIAVFFLLGTMRGSTIHQSPGENHIAGINLDVLQFTGIISKPPESTGNGLRFQVRLIPNAEETPEPDEGKVILVLNNPDRIWQYGDEIRVNGKITKLQSYGSNSYGEYLERQGISGLIYNPEITFITPDRGNLVLAHIFQLRAFLLEKVYRIFPEPENALMAGILLGDESQIPTEIDEAFQRTGTAHIIAISGMNFSVLIWLLLAFLRAIHHRWWTPLSLLPFIFFYTILTGANPAIIRAGIMCGIVLIGKSIGRDKNPIDSLLLTASVMGIQNPKILFDVGFQLSVTATLGILLFNKPINNFVGTKILRKFKLSANLFQAILSFLNDVLITSISAQILTVWIIAYAFHQFSWLSLLVNMLIAPLQTLIMTGGLAALLVAVLFEPIGKLIAILLYPVPSLTIRIVSYFGQFNWASQYTDLSALAAWTIILLILWLTINFAKIIHFQKETWMKIAIGGLAAVMLACWQIAIHKVDRRLRVNIRANSKSAVIQIRTPGLRKVILANGITNYEAQDLLQAGFLDPIPSALAVLNFTEEWMSDAFQRSDIQKPTTYILNDQLFPPDGEVLPLSDHQQFLLDGIMIEQFDSYLRNQSWKITCQDLNISIPNGVPPMRMQSVDDFITSANLLILSQKDDESLWLDALIDESAAPLIFSLGTSDEIEIYSDGENMWLFKLN